MLRADPHMESDRPAIQWNLPQNCSTGMSRTCWGRDRWTQKVPITTSHRGVAKGIRNVISDAASRLLSLEAIAVILGPVKLQVCQFLGCKCKLEFSGHPPPGAMQPKNFELRGQRWVKMLVDVSIHSRQVFECGLAACNPWM